MTGRGLSLLSLLALWTAAAPLPAQEAPYAGLHGRDIATLSADDIAELRAGGGWGLALAAELNGYAGPAHVLEMAAALDLTEAQRTQVQAVFDAMQAEARALGARFVAAEAALDVAFADGTITPARLAALTAEAGTLRAELRAVHLAAHIEIRPLLDQHQIAAYASLRGYGGGHATHDGHAGHGSGH